ncbi:MAG: M13 family metallopeptidase [Geothrix sp.]|uniref:M13 family metallopeptidase n=1 Tax=Geothrix sp. TaxID=1962974 RepID=UPI0017FD43A8|nr:M13 family metallopeptidase [Geothrix sp.]NWJ40196.1 M13 family metallopeptidase [Geothrix sp.]WIL21796.1 MAG: M13 family metallopeptidase [Geothrix sp.]
MPSPLRASLGLCLGLAALSLAAQSKPGVDPVNLDTTVRPCEDFYTFANGGWLKTHTIPSDKPRFGAFEEVSERNRAILKQILEETSAKTTWAKGSVQQKVGDFYAAGMDEAAIEKRGLAPLKPVLTSIEGLKDAKQLPALLAKLHAQGLPGGFSFFVRQDAKASTQYLGYLSQGGTGLPDRDYYLKDDARSKDIRAKYEQHITRMFQLAGDAPALAAVRAKVVLDLETRMAQVQWTRVEQRNPQKTYNKRNLEQMAKEAPGFDWKSYFQARGVKMTELNLSQPSYFEAFGKIASSVPAPQWRTYLRWHALNSSASLLPKAFGEESFAFQGKVLNGTPEQEPRAKRIEAATDRSLGDALGQLYVKVAFPPESKKRVLDMIENIRVALRERITNLDWMGTDTKQQAMKKLDAIAVKIGYPDKWKTYGFEVKRDDFFGNTRRAAMFRIQENLAKLGKPIDRKEWSWTPPTVNASYNPSMNDITFPAGILQPPFFDPKADDAVNYGSLGFVIGHEITHGFDDSGSQFDAEGNLKNWWTDADKKAYESRTDLVVKQYDAYEPLKGEHVNGKLTLGENIADIGGLKIAFAAYQNSLKGKPVPAPIEGFTGPQRFFLGAATVWRNHIREAALSVRLKTDPHSPGRERVNGPLSNLPEFYDAFGCGDGQPMKRDAKVRPAIW